MSKRRLIKDLPRPEKKFESFSDVQGYLERLVRAIEENKPSVFTGDIHMGTSYPTASLGKDGDLYIKY
jgi:hypothetical protein